MAEADQEPENFKNKKKRRSSGCCSRFREGIHELSLQWIREVCVENCNRLHVSLLPELCWMWEDPDVGG